MRRPSRCRHQIPIRYRLVDGDLRAETFRPLITPAAVRIWAAWQIAATGLSSWKKWRTGARPLPRAHGVNGMADGRQCLERHHDLVVLGEIADQHQDLLAHLAASHWREV
jgi:hypothetical protein